MTEAITEIVLITLKDGSQVDKTTTEGNVLQTALKSIKEHEGFVSYAYGRQVENPNVVVLYIDWKSQTSHQAFIDISSITDHPIQSYHVSASGGFPSQIASPFLQQSVFYNSSDEFLSNVIHLFKLIDDVNPEGYSGVLIEESVEKLVGAEGIEGRALVLFAGWDSLDAHTAARGLPVFAENAHLIVRDPFNSDMFHVRIDERS